MRAAASPAAAAVASACPAAPRGAPAPQSAPRSALGSCSAARAPRSVPRRSPPPTRGTHLARSPAAQGAGRRSSRETCRGHRGNFQIRGTRPRAVATLGLRVPACRLPLPLPAPAFSGAGWLCAGHAGNCSFWPTRAPVSSAGCSGAAVFLGSQRPPQPPGSLEGWRSHGAQGALPPTAKPHALQSPLSAPSTSLCGAGPVPLRGNSPWPGDGLLGPALPTGVPLIAGATCPPWGT